MKFDRKSSQLVQAIFVCAIMAAYLSVALGLLGYLKLPTASFLTLLGAAVGCGAAMIFLVSGLRRHGM